MSLNDIIDEALSLKPQERYMIIENLVESLNRTDPAIEALWVEESEKRLDAIKSGELETVPYEEIFQKQ